MASCVRNNPTKNYQNLIIGFQVTVENVWDVFLRHSVLYIFERRRGPQTSRGSGELFFLPPLSTDLLGNTTLRTEPLAVSQSVPSGIYLLPCGNIISRRTIGGCMEKTTNGRSVVGLLSWVELDRRRTSTPKASAVSRNAVRDFYPFWTNEWNILLRATAKSWITRQ